MTKSFTLFALGLLTSISLFATPQDDKSGPDGLDFAQLRTLSINGKPYYQAVLSTVCRNGDHGTSADYSAASTWATASAETKNPLGLYALAALLDGGLGVQADKAKAEELFKESAPGLKTMSEEGDFRACYAYAYLCYAGRGGVAQDKKLAASLFLKAADAGDIHAAYMTGILFQRGEGVEQNTSKAVEWLRKAALSGERKAQYSLGILYLKGGMIGSNKQEAVKWVIMAAESGDAEAQYLAGVLFENGNGGQKDMSKVLQYYHRAALQGEERAKKRLKTFADDMRKNLGIEKEPAKPDSPSANEKTVEAN